MDCQPSGCGWNGNQLLDLAQASGVKIIVCTGLAIEVHSKNGAETEEIIAFLTSHKVSPSRIILCRVDECPNFSLHCELERGGIILKHDTFYRPKYNPEHNLWPLIENMAKEKFCVHVALATDMAEAALLKYQSCGSAFGGLPGNIRVHLCQMGLEKKCIGSLMGKNIIRQLAMPVPN